MPALQTADARLDAAGQTYVVELWDDAGTTVSLNNKIIWKSAGNVAGPGAAFPPGSGWKRTTKDYVLVADIDGDHIQELVIYNDNDGWTGVLRWTGSMLTYAWGSPSPISGPGLAIPAGSGWRRGINDAWLAVDLDKDGAQELAVFNNFDLWTGVNQMAEQCVELYLGGKGVIYWTGWHLAKGSRRPIHCLRQQRHSSAE